MRVTTFFRWYDLWIGAYWDRKGRDLYVCPLPMVGVKIHIPARTYPHEPECGLTTPLTYCLECHAIVAARSVPTSSKEGG